MAIAPTTLIELEEMLAALLPALPGMIDDAVTGEGGIAKTLKIVGDVGTVARTAMNVLASNPAVTTPGTPAPPTS